MSTPQTPPSSQGYQGYQGYGPPPAEDNAISVLVHLSVFVFPILLPLIAYLIVKSDARKPMTRDHATEALNFQLSMTLYFLAVAALSVSGIALLEYGVIVIGILLMLALYVVSIVCSILAVVAAGKRQPYRYPATFRFVH